MCQPVTGVQQLVVVVLLVRVQVNDSGGASLCRAALNQERSKVVVLSPAITVAPVAVVCCVLQLRCGTVSAQSSQLAIARRL